jgi:hypothetical protein
MAEHENSTHCAYSPELLARLADAAHGAWSRRPLVTVRRSMPDTMDDKRAWKDIVIAVLDALEETTER